jgi:hypothetical protein
MSGHHDRLGASFGAFVLAATALLPASPADAGDITTGLVGHWKFDEASGLTAADSSGMGNDGTLTNMTGNEWAAGRIGGALAFDGVDDYVDAPAFSWPATGGAITVAFWNHTPGGQDSSAFSVGVVGASANRVQAHVPWSDNILSWDYGDKDWDDGRITADYAAPGYGLTDCRNRWTHVALVSEGNGGHFKGIYLDGVLVASEAGSDGPDIEVTDLQIGRMTDGVGGLYHIGAIDDFRIYGRVLSASDVAELCQYDGAVGVSIAAEDPDASEQGPDAGVFRITRTGDLAALTVNIGVDGDAIATTDYAASPDISGGSVQIEAGQSYVDVAVTPVSDAEYFEDPESVIITILPAGGGEYEVGSPSSATVTIADYTPPAPGTFLLTSPVDGEQSAGVTPTLTWSTSTDADSYAVVVADNDSFTSPVVDETLTVTSYNMSAVTLGYDTQYYWKVTATNVVTSTEATNNRISFWTSPDGPPTVLSTNPSDGASDASTSVKVRITFSEPMEKTSTEGAFTLADADDAEVTGTAVLSTDGMTLTFTPGGRLLEETTYTATLTTAATGLDGNALNAAESITFTTEPPLSGFATGEGCVSGAGGAAVAWVLLALACVGVRARGSALEQ